MLTYFICTYCTLMYVQYVHRTGMRLVIFLLFYCCYCCMMVTLYCLSITMSIERRLKSKIAQLSAPLSSAVVPVAHNYGPLTHIKMSKHIWSTLVKPGDTVIDATCGNGNDAIYLSSLALTRESGLLYCIDIQPEAVRSTEQRFKSDPVAMKEEQWKGRVKFVCRSHETFPSEIEPGSVSLICYNLGYLPGKLRTNQEDIITYSHEITNAISTAESLRNAVPLVKEGGLISVTAYPGNPGGLEEADAVRGLLADLSMRDWRVYEHKPLNRPLSPILFNAFRIEKFGYKV